jgi:pyruvate dehydrogenase E1 component
MLMRRLDAGEDANPQETSEWLDALDQVLDEAGPDRAAFLLERLADRAAMQGVQRAFKLNTPFLNTIAAEDEVPYPGDRELERRIKSLTRWNAMAMGVRAHFELRVPGHVARSGVQPFLPRQLG